MLQTVGFFRASILNSSYSAFKLALASHKNIDFATRIITAKSEGAHARLAKLNVSDTNYRDTLLKIRQYDSFLDKIDYIQYAGKSIYCLDYSIPVMSLNINKYF